MQENSRWRSKLFGIAVALFGVGGIAVAQAGTGTLAGKVLDRGTNLPIAEAQLQLAGTVRGARSNEQGEYRITSVPAGTYTLRVIRLGYSQTTPSVTVTGGQTTTADITLGASAVVIDQVVVTATGETQRRRESGASTTTISTENIPLPAVNNFSNTLSSRVAGLTVEHTPAPRADRHHPIARGALPTQRPPVAGLLRCLLLTAHFGMRAARAISCPFT